MHANVSESRAPTEEHAVAHSSMLLSIVRPIIALRTFVRPAAGRLCTRAMGHSSLSSIPPLQTTARPQDIYSLQRGPPGLVGGLSCSASIHLHLARSTPILSPQLSIRSAERLAFYRG